VLISLIERPNEVKILLGTFKAIKNVLLPHISIVNI
jgi:hypothetical protein